MSISNKTSHNWKNQPSPVTWAGQFYTRIFVFQLQLQVIDFSMSRGNILHVELTFHHRVWYHSATQGTWPVAYSLGYVTVCPW